MEPAASVHPKALQILEGAKQAFMEHGYEGCSVDTIARQAGVSKATVYSHFGDKRTLFSAVVERECDLQTSRFFTIEVGEPIDAGLRRIARQFVEFIVSPFAIQLFRLVVAETSRFPELGRAFYDSGPDLGHRRLMRVLAAAAASGELRISDPELAAHQFVELCKSDLFFRRLLGVRAKVTEEEIHRVADGAVETFLSAFGPEKR
ncbi:MAG: TetR/AcrR family transcriptional regulator [Myxococcota bacterium]